MTDRLHYSFVTSRIYPLDGIGPLKIQDIAFDKQRNKLYVAASNGYLYRKEENWLVRLANGPLDLLAGRKVRDIKVDSNGDLLIATRDRVLRYGVNSDTYMSIAGRSEGANDPGCAISGKANSTRLENIVAIAPLPNGGFALLQSHQPNACVLFFDASHNRERVQSFPNRNWEAIAADTVNDGVLLAGSRQVALLRSTDTEPKILMGGGPGFTEGGLAANAKAGFIADVDRLPNGEVVFVDSQNHRIRRIDRTGVVHTIAGGGSEIPPWQSYQNGQFVFRGGPGRQSIFSRPTKFAVTAIGDLFVIQFDGSTQIHHINSDTRIGQAIRRNL